VAWRTSLPTCQGQQTLAAALGTAAAAAAATAVITSTADTHQTASVRMKPGTTRHTPACVRARNGENHVALHLLHTLSAYGHSQWSVFGARTCKAVFSASTATHARHAAWRFTHLLIWVEAGNIPGLVVHVMAPAAGGGRCCSLEALICQKSE
jgi:hypothetical protein